MVHKKKTKYKTYLLIKVPKFPEGHAIGRKGYLAIAVGGAVASTQEPAFLIPTIAGAGGFATSMWGTKLKLVRHRVKEKK